MRARGFKTFTAQDLPKTILAAQYAVRGELVIKAAAMRPDVDAGKYPFKQLVACNIGNPQAVGQKPLTFGRQVMSIMACPGLLDQNTGFPDDVHSRARKYLAGVEKMGAYSHSAGHEVFRQDVAAYVTERDGHAADINDFFLSDGASPSCKTVLSIMCGDTTDGVLIPIPQYPLYSASLSLLGGTGVGYFLREAEGWSFGTQELETAVTGFKKNGGKPRALVVINPGNPTGGVLPRETIEKIISFAEKESLVILADEVYQDNIYGDVPFTSFRKVAIEMGTKATVFSVHSISKGFVGECGIRGGWLHMHNVDPSVKEQIYKLMSINLCSNTMGQAAMALASRPPVIGDASHSLWKQERDGIFASLRRKAVSAAEMLNGENMSCQPVAGAMYAFPSITVPPKAVEEAKKLGKSVDTLWCLGLLEQTGVICVPGSGFGQEEGTFHFRMTILPDEQTLDSCLKGINDFHRSFCEKYS